MGNATTWGTTAVERELPYPCDDLVERPYASLYRGVSVDAPPEVTFRWLCQLRAAPYSYDWIDNFGRRSPQQLTPGLEHLAVGQRVMRIFKLVSFERDRHLTLVMRRGWRILGDIAVTYAVVPADGGVRLLGKLVVRYPRGPLGWLARATLPWGDLIMMRRQLLNLRELAERQARETAA